MYNWRKIKEAAISGVDLRHLSITACVSHPSSGLHLLFSVPTKPYLNRLELSVLHYRIDYVCTCLPNRVFLGIAAASYIFISPVTSTVTHIVGAQQTLTGNGMACDGGGQDLRLIPWVCWANTVHIFFTDEFLFWPYFQMLKCISCPW